MNPRAVAVVTEVAALDRELSYRLDEAVGDVGLGDRVRVPLQARTVRAWVWAQATEDPETLRPVAKWLGYGPPPRLLDLAEWVAERWCAPLARVLVGMSPSGLVRVLPVAPLDRAATERAAYPWAPGPIHLGPTSDPLDVVLAAHEAVGSRPGTLLVLVPTVARAQRLVQRLRHRGLHVAAGEEWAEARAGWPMVVASRGGALASIPLLSGAVVVDADDESFISQATPTWDATSIVAERCRRDASPLWATSMLPSPALRARGELRRDPSLVRSWPVVRVVDRRSRDPHEGVLAAPVLEAAHRALGGDEEVAVAVILQRLGTGRLMACARCGALARCEVCAQAEREVPEGLACAEGHAPRPVFCRDCGATRLKRVRAGVSTLARDVGAQLGRPVSELTRSSSSASLERVVVGTEAVFSRVHRCALVVFADFDQYLLAPRATARREAITAVGRAGRLVGAADQARGSIMVQTRRGEDMVLRALRSRDFAEVMAADDSDARELGLAPYAYSAEVFGEGADELVVGLEAEGLLVRASAEGWRVSGADPLALGRALRVRARGTSVRVKMR